jgi:uncharacterized OB-fold protein
VSGGLRAPHVFAPSYRRSTGGADRVFLSGLAEAEIWGSRAADGRVLVPPVDYDPETGAATEEFVRLADTGFVRSWTWVAEPSPEQPADREFAYALVALDGADSFLLHVVDVDDESAMATGLRVRADWRSTRVGSILDIRAFVPLTAEPPTVGESSTGSGAPSATPRDASGAVEVTSQVHLEYTYEPGLATSAFLRAIAERRIVGGRCPSCAGVYVPPRSRCPACRVGPMTDVELGDRGVVTAYTVVHLPFPEMTVELPFVSAWIRLDGADVSIPHLLGEVAPEDARIGQRVEAVWVEAGELAPTWESIRYFRPSGSAPGPQGTERA